eukprot:1254405-Pyramimonas_sp.AAC.1
MPFKPETYSLDIARRSRDDLLLLGLSLLRYDRGRYGIRLRRSLRLGLATSFAFGSGAGLWRSAQALPLTIHGAICWATDT